MDEKVSTTTRKTYKIYDVLGQIGGFWSTVYITFYVIVNRFQTYIYQSNILTSLYVTSKKKKKKSQVAVEFFTPPEIKEPVTEFERMKKEIFSRKSYIFGFWNVFKLPFTRLRCLWSKITFEKFAKKKKVFEQGWDRVQKDIDIRSIVFEIRTLRFLIKSFLTRRQKYLISFFSDTVINKLHKKLPPIKVITDTEPGYTNIQEFEKLKLEYQLQKTIVKAQTSVKDKRILDALILKNKYYSDYNEEKDLEQKVKTFFKDRLIQNIETHPPTASTKGNRTTKILPA